MVIFNSYFDITRGYIISETSDFWVLRANPSFLDSRDMSKKMMNVFPMVNPEAYN